jgi:hypothetical protein
VRRVEAATLIFRVVPSSNVTLIVRRLGKNRLFVLLLAWLTLFPTSGPLPVIAHFLDMFYPLVCFKKVDILQKNSKSTA